MHANYNQVQTGDILLFSNWSKVGISIQLATANYWNHVGIAVWMSREESYLLHQGYASLPAVAGKNNKHVKTELYCFETNNNKEYDVITRTYAEGVRLVPVKTLEAKYNYIAWRPLALERGTTFYKKLWAMIEEYTGQPYHRSKLRMVMSALQMYWDERDPGTLDSFCSQLVARYLQRIGLLDDGPGQLAAYTYLPGNYSINDYTKKVPDNIFMHGEKLIYSNPALEWHWLVMLVVLATVLWLAIIYNRYLARKMAR